MFKLHKVRSMDWKKMNIVSLAMSIDETQVEMAHNNASIDI